MADAKDVCALEEAVDGLRGEFGVLREAVEVLVEAVKGQELKLDRLLGERSKYP